jgi:hypothetical protein
MGNVGTLLVFRIGPEDAALLESSFAPRCHMTPDFTGVRHVLGPLPNARKRPPMLA